MAFKSLGEKSCEIKGGGHEIAAMMWMIINFNYGIFCVDFTSLCILNNIPKANHKLDLRFVFTQIIVLLIYRCNENDIRQTSALPIQKNTYQSDIKANLY